MQMGVMWLHATVLISLAWTTMGVGIIEGGLFFVGGPDHVLMCPAKILACIPDI